MKIRFLKSLLCVILSFTILIPLNGCASKQPTYVNGKYVDSKGKILENNAVTLDVIAKSEYKKKFDKLKNENERKNVISLYLEYHLPAKSDEEIASKEILIEQLSSISVSNDNLAKVMKNGVDKTGGVLSKASSALALANIYANIKNDIGFEEFIEKANKANNISNAVTKFTQACLITVNLANTTSTISNKQEYCDEIIDALTFITSFVPFYDNYFEKTLETVKVGVQTVVEKYNNHYGNLSAYDAECNNKVGFFSIKQFEFILDSNKWSSDLAPSIADILKHSDQFHTIPAGQPFVCLKEYILYRISYESQNLQKAPTLPSLSNPYWSGVGQINNIITPKYSYDMTLSELTKDRIAGYLWVYTEVLGKTKNKHETYFEGEGIITDDGITYLITFDKSVTFGVSPTYTYTQMELYYNSDDNTFSFDKHYHVTMQQMII